MRQDTGLSALDRLDGKFQQFILTDTKLLGFNIEAGY